MMTVLPFLSIAIGLISVASAIVSVAAVRRERRDRQRAFAALAAELAQIRKELEALQPPARFPSPDGRRSLRRDRGIDATFAGPILIAVPDLAAPEPDTPTIPPEYLERFGGIWDLADTGASADAIARATGQPVGRIELILALRPRDDDQD